MYVGLHILSETAKHFCICHLQQKCVLCSVCLTSCTCVTTLSKAPVLLMWINVRIWQILCCGYCMQLSRQYVNSICHFGFVLVEPPNQHNILQYLVSRFEMTILWGFTANSFTPNRRWQLNYNLKPHHRNKSRHQRRQEVGSNESEKSLLRLQPHQRPACMHVLLE